jgi:hypothetical protein
MFFTSALFWFGMGILFVLVVAGAKVWFDDLGLKMNWWKWLLTILWFGLLNFSVAVPFTFAGENEPGAALRVLPFLIVPTLILGVGLWRVLIIDREPKVAKEA